MPLHSHTSSLGLTGSSSLLQHRGERASRQYTKNTSLFPSATRSPSSRTRSQPYPSPATPDGVMESREKWASPYFNDQKGSWPDRGWPIRTPYCWAATYQEFEAYWPNQTIDVQFADY